VGGSWACGEFGHTWACSAVVSRDWACWRSSGTADTVCLRGPACHLSSRNAAWWWSASATNLEVVDLSKGGFGTGTAIWRSTGSCIDIRNMPRETPDLLGIYLGLMAPHCWAALQAVLRSWYTPSKRFCRLETHQQPENAVLRPSRATCVVEPCRNGWDAVAAMTDIVNFSRSRCLGVQGSVCSLHVCGTFTWVHPATPFTLTPA
jgi:hypothetical protein